MVAIAPVNILNDNHLKILKKSLTQLIKHYKYKGILYVGVMLDKLKNIPYILEFNCRFGDPECQVLMQLLDTSLYNICMSCIYYGMNSNSFKHLYLNNVKKYINKLSLHELIKWKSNTFATCVVLSHKDYPQNISKSLIPVIISKELSLTNNLQSNNNLSYKIYFSSIFNLPYNNDKMAIYTYGGRVVNVVGISNKSLNESREIAYNIINKNYITYKDMRYRSDIGYNI